MRHKDVVKYGEGLDHPMSGGQREIKLAVFVMRAIGTGNQFQSLRVHGDRKGHRVGSLILLHGSRRKNDDFI